MRRDHMLESFITWSQNLNQNKTQNGFAPHKPLTIIYALNHILQGKRWIEYQSDRQKLESFIDSFISSKANCLYPLWRLKNDNKISTHWVTSTEGFISNASGDISVSQAKEHGLKAGFSNETYQWLSQNLEIVQFLIGEIIEDNFPETLEEEILIHLGLDKVLPQIVQSEKVVHTITQNKRDPLFPSKVMQAYDYRCSFCGLKIYHHQKPVSMEAAHIKWKARGGECHETNGLSLCPTHHYTFDKGIWSLNMNLEIMINSNVLIDRDHDSFFTPFEGKSIIRKILDKSLVPKEEYVEWHRVNIFKDN